jgi:hypothetical protein
MTLTTIALLVAGIIAVLLLVCYALPSATTVTRSAVINANADTIYPLIASSQGFQRFNPYCDADPELTIELFGPENGVGSGFAFNGKEGKGTQTIIEAEQNSQVTMQIDLGAMGKPIQTFRLEDQGDGTRVTWSTRADFGINPVGRVFGLFLDKMLGKTYERGLVNLANVVAVS